MQPGREDEVIKQKKLYRLDIYDKARGSGCGPALGSCAPAADVVTSPVAGLAAAAVPCRAGKAVCIRQRHALRTRHARKQLVSFIAADVLRVSIAASCLPRSSIERNVWTCGMPSGCAS